MASSTIPAPDLPQPPASAPVKLKAWHKALLLLGLAWALAVISPDFYRLYWPLGTVGFQADNSGYIYSVDGPPATTVSIPNHPGRGLQVGDTIPLSPGACWHPTSETCIDYLSIFGGMSGLGYVRIQPTIILPIMLGGPGKGERISVTLQPRPHILGPGTQLLLALCQLAGVFMIWRAFRLVWNKPGLMTLGFFLYAMWFNPGQYFALYAWLQEHPILLLSQETLQAIAQGAGYAGFLIFALRFPHNRTEPQFLWMEQLAVALGVILAGLQLVSFLNVFGVPTEIYTRSALLGGYAVPLYAIFIAWRRWKLQSPLDYQRMRWVLWGCAIGIPAFIFADSNEATSLWVRYVWSWNIWRGWSPDEAVFEAGFLISGVLAIFICEASRRQRVVNVSYELRGLAGSAIVLLLLAVGEAWMHEPLIRTLRLLDVPDRLHFPLIIVALLACGIAGHQAGHLAGHFLNRTYHHGAAQLEALGAKMIHSFAIADVDCDLINGPAHAFALASAAVFREDETMFRRISPSIGWRPCDRTELDRARDKRLLTAQSAIRLSLQQSREEGWPPGLVAPSLAVPVIVADKLFAIALYGPHETGADLDPLEEKALERFAEKASIGYEKAMLELLEKEVQDLRRQVHMPAGLASGAAT